MKSCPPSSVLCPAALALLLAATACQSPPPPVSQGKAGVAMPTLASTPDVRTEAAIIQMENQYITEKNDQPTRQHEAEAKAAKKRKAAAEKAAKEQVAREQKAAQAKALAEAGK